MRQFTAALLFFTVTSAVNIGNDQGEAQDQAPADSGLFSNIDLNQNGISDLEEAK